MAILTVNGVDMPSPSAMRVGIFDLASDQQRNALGELVLDRVGAKLRLELRWACLSADQMKALLAAMGQDGFFEAGYPDPMTGGMRTITCHCAERATGVLRMDGGAAVWTDVEMTWIER